MRSAKVVLLLLALVAAPGTAVAQEESGHIALVVGRADWDLSGTGHSPVWGLRVGAPLNPNIGWELNLSYLHPEQDIGPTHLFIPELQFQLQHTWSGFTPYIGVGAGAAIDRLEDDGFLGLGQPETRTRFAPSGSIGARIRIVQGLAAQAEGRLHGIDADFTGTVTELTGGVVVSF